MKSFWRGYVLGSLIPAAFFLLVFSVWTGLIRASEWRESLFPIIALLLFSIGIRDLFRWLFHRQIQWQEERNFSLLRLVIRKFRRSKTENETDLHKGDIAPKI